MVYMSSKFREIALRIKTDALKKVNLFCWLPAGINMFKVNNRNTRTICEICSKLTIKTPERRQMELLVKTVNGWKSLTIYKKSSIWHRSGVFIVNFEQIHRLFWYFYCWLLTSKYHLGYVPYNSSVISCSVSDPSSFNGCNDNFYVFNQFNPLRANPTKWSNILEQFVGKIRRIVWVCLTILWCWRLKV